VTAHVSSAIDGTRRDCFLAGSNKNGQLGDNTLALSDYYVPTPVNTSLVSSWLAISAGSGSFTCGLAADSSQYGKAYCWGELPPRPSKSPQRQVL
jgi:hypothetical protein